MNIRMFHTGHDSMFKTAKVSSLLILIGLIISSCGSKEEKLLKEMYPIVKSWTIDNMGIDSNLHQLDTLYITEIDTLTDLVDSIRMKDYLVFLVESMNQQAEYFQSIAKLKQSSARLKFDNARLYKAAFGSDLLVDMELKDAKALTGEVKSNLDESMKILEKSQRLLSRVRAIDSLIDANAVDSSTFRGYVVMFSYEGADIKGSQIKIDSATLTLSDRLRLMPHYAVEKRK